MHLLYKGAHFYGGVVEVSCKFSLPRHHMFFDVNTDLILEISFPESDGSRIYLVILGLKYLVFCFVLLCFVLKK